MRFGLLALLEILPILTTNACPWAVSIASGSDALRSDGQLAGSLGKRTSKCPPHQTRQGAAPYNSYYPSMYTGARDGRPGTGKGHVLVPAKNDEAHAYVAPSETDIRGPCPGLNALANHNFISHDGITTYTEMVDAAQNVYNWKYDLASFVATFGLVQDGDPVTEILSIGCNPSSAETDTGLNTHNKFEADSSLTRTDYALSPTHNAYSLNGSLFGEFVDTCQKDNFRDDCMGFYAQKRFNESLNTNGNFFNGPLSVFVYGTATLPVNSFANFASGSPIASVDTISSYWGASKASNGSWYYSRNERIPADWYNRPSALSLQLIAHKTNAIYQKYPAPFGGNLGAPNTFVGLNYPGFIENGALKDASTRGLLCLLYQTATIALPTSLTQTIQLPSLKKAWGQKKLDEIFAKYACSS